MIGGLQGEFGDLDIKYLKQNISKCRSHISGSFRRTPRHYAKWLLYSPGKRYRHCAKWLRNSPGKRYQRIRIRLTGEVETPSSPIRRQASDVKYPDGMCRMWNIRVEWRRSRILDVRHPDGMAAEQSSGCETSGWNVDGATPSGFPKRTRSMLPYSDSLRENHMTLAIITPRTIAYPIRICCPDHWRPRSAALRWCVRKPCSDIFCHGFQRTLLNLGLLWWSKSYQNTKT